MPVLRVVLFAAVTAVLAGCGGESASARKDPLQAVDPSIRTQVAAAAKVDAGTFPAAPERSTLEDFSRRFQTGGPQAVAASSVLRPPSNRLAFGLLDANQRFAYGRTVVYVQRRGTTDIAGPIAAPADVLVTQPRYRS